MRNADLKRRTAETDISLSLCLEGSGSAEIDSGAGFLDHMLTLFARHGGFDLKISCRGDTNVDYHHTTEDIGICLGAAFAQALGGKAGITRYGQSLLPMDESRRTYPAGRSSASRWISLRRRSGISIPSW